MFTDPNTLKQSREHAVPCLDCGVDVRRGLLRPRNYTWNPSGLCDKHEVKFGLRPAAAVREDESK